MNSFWKYYSGEAIAPYPTIFIGGNHEASNYLWELYYGGWAAPNIYFLGFAGVVKFGNLRIGGLSGLYGPKHYRLGHYERPPYNEGTIKSLYHVREYNVHKLMQVEEPIDIFLSHDWPVGITLKELFKFKKDFEQDIKDRRLGSEAAAQLLQKLKPPYCFSAHLHCKFAARVRHGEDGPVTNFLALNKCCRESKGEFLQVIDVESGPGPYEIQYDEEWLGITRQFNSVFPLTVASANFSNVYLDKEACQNWVRSKLQARGARPFEFCRTVPSHDPDSTNKFDSSRGAFPGCNRNPQTESLLQFLELPYLLDNMSESLDAARSSVPSIKEIFIDDVDESDPEE